MWMRLGLSRCLGVGLRGVGWLGGWYSARSLKVRGSPGKILKGDRRGADLYVLLTHR